MISALKRSEAVFKHVTPLPADSPAPLSIKDALTLLKLDHRYIEDLFAQYEIAYSEDSKQQLVAEICEQLTQHIFLEENILYPAVRPMLGNHQLLDVAMEGNTGMQWLIKELQTEPFGSVLCSARIVLLNENFKKHVKMQETQLFPKIRRSSMDLNVLGRILQAAKASLRHEVAH